MNRHFHNKLAQNIYTLYCKNYCSDSNQILHSNKASNLPILMKFGMMMHLAKPTRLDTEIWNFDGWLPYWKSKNCDISTTFRSILKKFLIVIRINHPRALKTLFVSRRTSCYGRRTTCSVREDKHWILYLLTALVIGSSVSLLWEMMLWLSLSVSCIRYQKG